MTGHGKVFDFEPVTRRPRAQSRHASVPGDGTTSDDKLRFERELGPPAEEIHRPPTLGVSPVKKIAWLARRGHMFSYLGLFFFTIAVYLRPYELIPGLAPFSTMAYWIAIFTLSVFFPVQLSLEGNLTARPREVNLMLLFGLCALLSIPLAADPGNSWATFSEFFKVILIFIVMINVLRTWARWRGVFLVLLGTSCYLSVSAVSNYLQGRASVEGFRAGGIGTNMFINPNDMALFLVTLIPLAAALFLGNRNVLIKIFYAVCMLLILGAILFSYSRGGFVGLLAAIGVMIWKVARRRRLVGFGLAVTLVFLLLVLAPGGFAGRFSAIMDVDSGSSATSRREELKKSIIITLRYPLFGVGMGNYRARSDRALVTHNAYTQVSSEMGIPALVIYIMFIVVPLKRLRRLERDTEGSRRVALYHYLAIGLQAALVGYMVSSFFASVAYLWHIYYLVALSICFSQLYDVKSRAGEVGG